MFKMIAAAVLLSSAGLALASDVSYDQQQIRAEKAAPKDAGAKTDAPRPAACTCQHS